jgi:exopolysaccharide biosynthesis polyprenyl glycosylphosphotransferase
VVGYVDLPPGATQHTPPGNVPYLGSYEDLTEVLQREFVNVVILTDVNIPRNAIVEVAATCEKELVDFKIIPSYFPILVSAMQVEHLSGIPVLGVDKLPLNSLANRLVKRAVDILGALAGLAIAAPFILVFGILIYLESPGSIFFRQERIGRRGLRFDMFKLRSMRPDAAAQDHLAQSTVRGDPRLLRVGAFMRRWNIDELPQFWNVLVGDMSLVGPRPERTYHSEILKNQIPHYNARYISKPGLTGWAQIHGLRGDTDLTERIQHDIHYMEHWTVLLDIQIAFRTIFSFKNAC